MLAVLRKSLFYFQKNSTPRNGGRSYEMAVNQFGQTYQGNDDFRGWLAGNAGKNVSFNNYVTTAGDLLNYVGNDGRVGGGGVRDALAQQLYATWQS
jgi:hypothetical protein